MTPDERLRIELDELEQSSPDDLPPTTMSRVRPGWRRLLAPVAVTVSAALLLAIGLPRLLDNETPVALGPTPSVSLAPLGSATPSAAPLPTATLTEPPGPSVVATPNPPLPEFTVPWTKMPWSGRVNGVSYDSQLGLWLAFGSEQMWTSTDAVSWNRHAFDGELIDDCCPSPAPPLMVGAVRMGGQLWAAGRFDNTTDGIALLMWTSTDGTTWQVLPQGGYGRDSIGGIASNGSLLAVPSHAFAAGQGAVHTSLDGQQWVQHQPGGAAGMVDIYGDMDGFVAVGYRYSEALGSRPAIWTSPDGLNWVDVSPDSPLGELQAVARLTDGTYLAVGADNDRSLMIWRSEDGNGWSQVPFSAPPFPVGYYQRLGLASSGDIVVLTANVGDGWRAWASYDGAAWGELRQTTEQPPFGVVLGVRGTQIVLFAEAGPGREDSDLWIGQLAP